MCLWESSCCETKCVAVEGCQEQHRKEVGDDPRLGQALGWRSGGGDVIFRWETALQPLGRESVPLGVGTFVSGVGTSFVRGVSDGAAGGARVGRGA